MTLCLSFTTLMISTSKSLAMHLETLIAVQACDAVKTMNVLVIAVDRCQSLALFSVIHLLKVASALGQSPLRLTTVNLFVRKHIVRTTLFPSLTSFLLVRMDASNTELTTNATGKLVLMTWIVTADAAATSSHSLLEGVSP